MTPPTPNTPSKAESVLQTLLSILGIAATAASPLIPAGGGQEVDQAIASLVKIAQAANQAHLDHTGQPIDLSLLQPIDLVPDPPTTPPAA